MTRVAAARVGDTITQVIRVTRHCGCDPHSVVAYPAKRELVVDMGATATPTPTEVGDALGLDAMSMTWGPRCEHPIVSGRLGDMTVIIYTSTGGQTS